MLRLCHGGDTRVLPQTAFCKFIAEYASEKIFKISQHLINLLTKKLGGTSFQITMNIFNS